MTIAEVLVALTVFALALLFLLPLLPAGLHSQRQAANRSMATELALGEVERLSTLPALPPVGHTSRQVPDFAIGTDVRAVSGFAPERLLEIEVRVTWKERGTALSVVQVTRVCGARF